MMFLVTGLLLGSYLTAAVAMWAWFKYGRPAIDVETARVSARYERVIASLTASVERVSLTAQYGGQPMAEGRVESREPTPEERLGRMIDEDVIARASDALRKEYRAIGVTVTDDELRAEVIGLMTGSKWQPPAELQGLVKN